MKILILVLSVFFSQLVISAPYTENIEKVLEKSSLAKENAEYEARKLRKQKDVSRMYFFVNHIDEEGTFEKMQLDAFLLGLKSGYSTNFYMEQKTFGRSWFCRDKTPFFGSKGDDFVISLIKWVYENYSSRFSKESGIYSPTASALAFGLQINYLCHLNPKVHIPGYDYSRLPTSHVN